MSLHIISAGNSTGCSPSSEPNASSSCASCAPKLALSYEEEAILGRMRLVKNEARPIAGRVKELESQISLEAGYRRDILKNEHTLLSQQLYELRRDFNEWSGRLEDATERKLILLGHREPSQSLSTLN